MSCLHNIVPTVSITIVNVNNSLPSTSNTTRFFHGQFYLALTVISYSPERSDLLIFNSNAGGTLHPKNAQTYRTITEQLSPPVVLKYFFYTKYGSSSQVYQYIKIQRKKSSTLLQMDKMLKDAKILLSGVPKLRNLVSIYKLSLVENKNREWCLAYNLTVLRQL